MTNRATLKAARRVIGWGDPADWGGVRIAGVGTIWPTAGTVPRNQRGVNRPHRARLYEAQPVDGRPPRLFRTAGAAVRYLAEAI